MAQDPTIGFDSDDPEMAAAIEEAKRTFRQFLEAFQSPRSGQSAFLVKVAFVAGQDVEHIWIADLEIRTGEFRGVIANEPTLRGFRFMQSVDFAPNQITDWMYIEDGMLVGGYSTRLIRKRMSQEERAALDSAAPYFF